MRPISPLDLPDVIPADLTGMRQPDFDIVDPTDLEVDDTYQRDLTRKSRVLIEKIVAEWRWSKFKPPICVRIDGRLRVVDGQHTAIAAATHPGITVIPVIVVDEPEMVDQARAFVSHARDRLAATPGQVWRAEVAAGDPQAVAIEQVCAAAGVKLLAFPPAGSAYKVGDTVAIASIKALLGRRGAEQSAMVLAALADSELAPISGDAIKAAEALLCEDEYALDFDVERLAASIRALGPRAITEAKALAAAKTLPLWRALAAVVFKHRKGRSPPPSTSTSATAASVLHVRRVIDRTPPSGPVYLGEPLPGRSALDQRRPTP